MAPAIYRNVPPVSAKGVVAGGYDHGRVYPPPRRVPPRTPPSLSPPQARRSRRERIPRAAMTARKRLDFDEPSSPKSYVEYLESLVADVPMPTHVDIPPVPPAAHIEFRPPAWSPVPITTLERAGMKGIEMEEPPDWDQFESPRTPRVSPGLPYVDVDDRLADVSPPLDLAFDLSQSPLSDVSPPFGMDELDEFEETPPCSPVCGGQSPEELQQRLREHEYTIHKGDARKRHLKSKYVHVKGRPYKVEKARRPGLTPLQEQEEISESPRRRSPGIAEGRLLDVTPPAKDHMREVMDLAKKQYAMLLDSPEKEGPDVVETTTTEEYIIDQPIGVAAQMALPLPVQEAYEFDLPPLSPPLKIPPRYVPPPQQVTSPEMMRAMLPMGTDDYMLDYMESPPLMSTPPRDIFDEAMAMEEEEEEDIEALLTGSPVRRTPPGSIKVALDKLIMPQLFEKRSQYAADHCKLLHRDTENDVQELLNSATIRSNSYTFSQSYTDNPFNDLAYCIEKGLDYYPTKESVLASAIFSSDIKIVNAKPTNVTKAIILNLPEVAHIQSFVSSTNTENFTFSYNYSYYTVAFFHFLLCDETDEVNMSNASKNATGCTQSTLSPICSSNPQHQYRTATPDRLAQIKPQSRTSTPIGYSRPHRPLTPAKPMESTDTSHTLASQNEQFTLSPIRSNPPRRHCRPITMDRLAPMDTEQLTSTPISYNQRQQLFQTLSPARTSFNTTPSSRTTQNAVDPLISSLSPISQDNQQAYFQRLTPIRRNMQLNPQQFTSTPIRYNSPQQFRSSSPIRSIPNTWSPTSRVQTAEQQFQSLSRSRTMPNATPTSTVVENIDSLHSTLSPIHINDQQQQARHLLRNRRDIQMNSQPLTSTPIRYNLPQHFQSLPPDRRMSPQLQRANANTIRMNSLQRTSTPKYSQRPSAPANLMETVYQSPRANDFTPSLSSIEISPCSVNNRPSSPLNTLGPRLPLTLPRSLPKPMRQMTYNTLPYDQSNMSQQASIQEDNPNISRSRALDTTGLSRLNSAEFKEPICACVKAYLNRERNLEQPQFNSTEINNFNQFSTSRQMGQANVSNRLPTSPVSYQTQWSDVSNEENLTFAGFRQKHMPSASYRRALSPRKVKQNGVSFNYSPWFENNKIGPSRDSDVIETNDTLVEECSDNCRPSSPSSKISGFQGNISSEDTYNDFQNLGKHKTSTPIKENKGHYQKFPQRNLKDAANSKPHQKREDIANTSDLCDSECPSKIEEESTSALEPIESHQTQDIPVNDSTSYTPPAQSDQKKDITSEKENSPSEHQDSKRQVEVEEGSNDDTEPEDSNRKNTGCYACCAQSSSIPVSQRWRNISRPLSQSHYPTRSHDTQPNYDKIRRRLFNTTDDTSEQTSTAEPEYNIVRKRLFTPTKRRESDPLCGTEHQYPTVRKRLFTPSPVDDFSSASVTVPEYNIVRKRLFTPSTDDDLDTTSDTEPEYNIVRKRLFTPRKYDSDSTRASEPQYNIVRKRLFTPSTENDYSRASVSVPDYNIVRKRLFTPTTQPDTDEVPVSEPEYNVVRKRLFTECSPKGSLPQQLKVPCGSNKCKNGKGSLDDKLLADISHHLDSLPANTIGKNSDSSETKSLPTATHVIISAYGPIYVTSIPQPSSVMKITAIETTRKDDTIPTLDKSALPENLLPQAASTPKHSNTELLSEEKSQLPYETPPSESVKSPLPSSNISKVPSVPSKTVHIPSDDLQPQLKKSSSPTSKSSKIPIAVSKTSHTSNETQPLHTPKSPSSILKNLKTELPSPETTEESDKSKSRDQLEISTPTLPAETSIESSNESVTKITPACPTLCPVQTQTFLAGKKRSESLYSKKDTSASSMCSKMCSSVHQLSNRNIPKIIQRKKSYPQNSTKSSVISSVMPKDTCLETCPKYLFASGCILPLEEDFVQNITLDDKIKSNKNKTYFNKTTDNKISNSTYNNNINDTQPPNSNNITKYFKSSPCLDIVSAVPCKNINCGTQNQTLLLEDWADELEVIDDPGYRSIQTQYFHSETIEPRLSVVSGCPCKYCDTENST